MWWSGGSHILQRSLRALYQAIEVRNHFLDVHDVGIFVMDVKEIDFVDQERAIIGALFDYDVVKSIGIGIHCTRTHTA
jgi:hypothetical protein